MATKQIGLGTVVKVDEDDSGSTFTSVTLVVDCTPPPRTRVDIEQTALEDTLATVAEGIEEAGKFTFIQFWHPTDTVHASLDTLFGSKSQVIFNITYPHGTPITDSFEGVVCALEPETIATNGMIRRRVSINRKTAITRT